MNRWETVIDTYQCGKGYSNFQGVGSSVNYREPLSTKGENMEEWWTFPGVTGQPKLLWVYQHLIQEAKRDCDYLNNYEVQI